MNRQLIVLLLLVVAGCSPSESVGSRDLATSNESGALTLHPTVDFDHWSSVFPIETFQKTSGPRQFSTTEKDSPLDLWKPSGAIITSPAHLCEIELVRKQYANTQDLGPPVPVDIFLWSINPPAKPFLTKLGGTPHRESTKPWPNRNGEPFTFVAQFCFADSREIVSKKIPGDVMLIFFKNADALYEDDSIHVEWSSMQLESPMTADECPRPSFTVPQLSGHIYRTNEYPRAGMCSNGLATISATSFPRHSQQKSDARRFSRKTTRAVQMMNCYVPSIPFIQRHIRLGPNGRSSALRHCQRTGTSQMNTMDGANTG